MDGVRARGSSWFERRTWDASALADVDLDVLLRRKQASAERVSVVLPARNEAATVGEIVRTTSRDLVAPGLVDEVLVVDSHSVDETAAVARAAGATVVRQGDVLPEAGDRKGKGEAMWKALAVARGDLVVFLDADLEEFDSRCVSRLLAPLLFDPDVHLVKAMYERPLPAGAGFLPSGGGRVTELVARPLINAFWPELAGLAQPLAGEYAARRRTLERVPFVSGYGVELGLLVDLLDLVGLEAIAQVDLGRRLHRHQSDEALGRMAMEIQLTAHRRLERQGRIVSAEPPSARLTQFRRGRTAFDPHEVDIDTAERPPLAELVGQVQPGRRRLLDPA
jgi:glucosyl-3-phosphoglycerate synthase